LNAQPFSQAGLIADMMAEYGGGVDYWTKRIGFIDILLLNLHRTRPRQVYKSASEYAAAKGIDTQAPRPRRRK